jgi:hypothetical protein
MGRAIFFKFQSTRISNEPSLVKFVRFFGLLYKIDHSHPNIANHNIAIMRRQSRHFGHVRGTGLWIMLMSLLLVMLAISIASHR